MEERRAYLREQGRETRKDSGRREHSSSPARRGSAGGSRAAARARHVREQGREHRDGQLTVGAEQQPDGGGERPTGAEQKHVHGTERSERRKQQTGAEGGAEVCWAGPSLKRFCVVVIMNSCVPVPYPRATAPGYKSVTLRACLLPGACTKGNHHRLVWLISYD